MKRLNKKAHLISEFFFIFSIFSLYALPQSRLLLKTTVKDFPQFSRVTLSSDTPLNYSLEKSGSYLLVNIDAQAAFRIQRGPVESRFIKSLGWMKSPEGYTLTIETQHHQFRYDSRVRERPFQLIIDFYPVEEEKRAESPLPEKAKEKPLEAVKKEPPKRFRTIVIDPGHGGLETGAKGKFGTLEKDVTLAITLKLKEILGRHLSCQVVLTRDSDIDVSLENRAALANNRKADLFISIHTNGSYRKNAQGSETFFLSLDATDEESRKLAYLENNSAELESQIEKENEEDLKMILWDMAQAAFIKQSSELAEIIQKELNELLGTVNRGIKQAPFKVLTGVACPAVLVEVAFISNPEEEKKLVTEEFQENVAQAIYRGVLAYIRQYSQK